MSHSSFATTKASHHEKGSYVYRSI